MFQVLDTDNDGHITEEELKSVFNDDFDAKAFIAEFDSDGDNQISLKEFISVLTQVSKSTWRHHCGKCKCFSEALATEL